jgi:hypothetical protein
MTQTTSSDLSLEELSVALLIRVNSAESFSQQQKF